MFFTRCWLLQMTRKWPADPSWMPNNERHASIFFGFDIFYSIDANYKNSFIQKSIHKILIKQTTVERFGVFFQTLDLLLLFMLHDIFLKIWFSVNFIFRTSGHQPPCEECQKFRFYFDFTEMFYTFLYQTSSIFKFLINSE